MAPNPLRWRRSLCAIAFLLVAAAQVAEAQLPDFGSFDGGGLGGSEETVSLEAEFAPAQEGRPALLFVTARIARGYHVFAVDQGKAADGGGPLTTTLTLSESKDYKLLGAFQPLERPKVSIDQEIWKGLELREHEDRVTWVAPVELAAGVDPASVTIEGELDGQACNPSVCVPLTLPFAAQVGEGKALPPGFFSAASATQLQGAELAGTAAAPAPVAESPRAASESLAKVALYGILGGLILNLMPCVLPVLGLKILSFAKQGGQSRRHVLGLNTAYAAGLLTVLMVLATLAVLVQLGLNNKNFGWGELNTLTWFKVAMTGLVFSMALAFLGVWEIPIPGFATTGTATKLSGQEGPVGAFCMGIFTTLLATPCSGPFLGPVLGFTITQPPLVTYLIFASIGVGMALPYLLIGAFPSLVAWIPKPGAWMDTFKQLLGFVLLGSVVYLFSTINKDYFLATLALMFAIWFGCWIIGRAPAWAEMAQKRSAWLQGIMAAAVIGGASFTMLSPSDAELPWQPYSPEALAEARAQGKTVLVDFTANWCLTCKLNLKTAINREAVRELIQRNDVVPLLADWTDKNDAIKTALAELNSLSIPLMAIYPADPGAEVIVLRDLLTQGDVVEALEQAGPSQVAKETKTASRGAMSASSER